MGKDRNKDAMHQRKFGIKFWLFGGLAAVMVIAAIVTGLIFKRTAPEAPRMKISTPYIDLVLPQELEGLVIYDESVYGTICTYGFYLDYDGKETPLWRVDFGDANAGDWVGILDTDQGCVPVAMTLFKLSAEELSALGEEGANLYGACMQAYTVMLDGMKADNRFTDECPLEVGADTVVNLTYWNVTLPDRMEVLENTQGSNYEAVFLGEVAGEMVSMYRICIGEEQAKSLLGYYEIDGIKKAVSVESFSLEGRESWSEDDYTTAYRMMDTINDVLSQITSSEHFTEIENID